MSNLNNTPNVRLNKYDLIWLLLFVVVASMISRLLSIILVHLSLLNLVVVFTSSFFLLGVLLGLYKPTIMNKVIIITPTILIAFRPFMDKTNELGFMGWVYLIWFASLSTLLLTYGAKLSVETRNRKM